MSLVLYPFDFYGCLIDSVALYDVIFVSSGRTQFEQLNKSQARRSVKFERQPSKRFSRRQSLEARERTRRRQPPASLLAKQQAGYVTNKRSYSIPSSSIS